MSVTVALPQADEWPADGAIAEWYQPDGASVRTGDPVCRVEASFVSLELDAEGEGILTYRPNIGASCPGDGVLALIVAEGEPLPAFEPPSTPESEAGPTLDEVLAPMDEGAPAGDLPAAPGPATIEPGTASSAPFQEWRFDPEQPHSGLARGAGEEDSEPGTGQDDQPADTPPASVLPFPRRFSLAHTAGEGSAWDAVPGDATDFASPLVAAKHIEEPDFAAWVDAGHEDPDTGEQPATWGWQPWTHSPAPQDQPGPVATVLQALFLRVTVDLSESRKMRDQLAHEWQASAIEPLLDDIALRAAARALRALPELSPSTNLALHILTPAAQAFRVVPNAAGRPFRDAVFARSAARETTAETAYDCVVTSFAALGVEDATPRLEPGKPFALALGAERQATVLSGGQFIGRPVASITIAYDAAIVDDATAARLLARIRELLESPYALLAD